MPALTAGLADNGTRLIARFTNVPNGVEVWVQTGAYLVNTLATGTQTGVVRLVTTDPNGAGPFSATPAGSTVISPGLAQVSIVGGAGQAVWEVVATDSTATERTRINVVIAYKANTGANLPGLGEASVAGSLAPLSTVSGSSSSAPVPRFVDTSSAKKLFKISACVTNLLFPFVSNQAGFDTGLVISNTSQDPYGTSSQAGACEIYYYGATAGGGAAPATQTSTTVAAGGQVIWTLSGGGTNNVTATPGFQGYIIARCYFQYGHGFAFISDAGAQKLAHGYLALILDTPLSSRTGSTSEALGQ
jgi:hypothetical protein